MTKYEQTIPLGADAQPGIRPKLFVAAKPQSRSKVLMMPSAFPMAPPEGSLPAMRRFARGRKGRRAAAKRRALDGAFLALTAAAVAVLWWSSI